jgi:hypothetical protein
MPHNLSWARKSLGGAAGAADAADAGGAVAVDAAGDAEAAEAAAGAAARPGAAVAGVRRNSWRRKRVVGTGLGSSSLLQ